MKVDGEYRFCHGKCNIEEFVTANVESQLQWTFEGTDLVGSTKCLSVGIMVKLTLFSFH